MTTKAKVAKPQKPATPRIPTASVTLGGRERVLEFSMWSLQCLEELTGRPWHHVLVDLQLGYQRASLHLLWACLQHEDDPPALKDLARSLPTDGSVQTVFDTADRVLRDALPQLLKAEGTEDGPLAAGAA